MVCDPLGRRRGMWTTKNRGRYDRSKLPYPNGSASDEWTLIRTLNPLAKRGDHKRTFDVREVVNGLMYILSTGRQCLIVIGTEGKR